MWRAAERYRIVADRRALSTTMLRPGTKHPLWSRQGSTVGVWVYGPASEGGLGFVGV